MAFRVIERLQRVWRYGAANLRRLSRYTALLGVNF